MKKENIMKKLTVLAITAAMTAMMITGCSYLEPQGPDMPYEATEEEKLQHAQEDTVDVSKFVTSCDFEKVGNTENASEHAHITARNADGDVLWEYDTEEAYVGQYDNFQEIGLCTAGYLFVADGKVYCVDVTDGNECTFLWVNDSNVGASCCFTFGDNGCLYICGYDGPELTIIDSDGNTVAQYAHLAYPEEMDGADYFWPNLISCDELDPSTGYIRYDGGFEDESDSILYVDFENGKVLGIAGKMG